MLIGRNRLSISFLDTKIKNDQIDPDKKWVITTWNDYLWRPLKLFFRLFHNKKIIREINGQEVKPEDVVRAYEEELGRRVCSLAVVSDGFPLPSGATVMVVSGGVLSQCPNLSQLCDVSKADHLITLLTPKSARARGW